MPASSSLHSLPGFSMLTLQLRKSSWSRTSQSTTYAVNKGCDWICQVFGSLLHKTPGIGMNRMFWGWYYVAPIEIICPWILPQDLLGLLVFSCFLVLFSATRYNEFSSSVVLPSFPVFGAFASQSHLSPICSITLLSVSARAGVSLVVVTPGSWLRFLALAPHSRFLPVLPRRYQGQLKWLSS